MSTNYQHLCIVIPGHWERDTIRGAGQASAVGTLGRTHCAVRDPRKTRRRHRQVCGRRLQPRTQPDRCPEAPFPELRPGQGNGGHVTLSDRTGIKVCFADPHREPEVPSPRRLPVGAQNLCSAVVTVVVLDT
jgi:hypothetical protein